VMGLWLSGPPAKRAMVRADKRSFLERSMDSSVCFPNLRMFSFPFKNVLRKFFGVIRSPLSIRFESPCAMFLAVLFNIFFVALVDFLSIQFAVLALLFKNLFFSSVVVRLLEGFSCFRVFQWHGIKYATNVSLTGGF